MTLPYQHRIDWTDRGTRVTVWGPLRDGYRAIVVWAELRPGSVPFYASGARPPERVALKHGHGRAVHFLGASPAAAFETQADIESWISDIAHDHTYWTD